MKNVIFVDVRFVALTTLQDNTTPEWTVGPVRNELVPLLTPFSQYVSPDEAHLTSSDTKIPLLRRVKKTESMAPKSNWLTPYGYSNKTYETIQSPSVTKCLRLCYAVLLFPPSFEDSRPHKCRNVVYSKHVTELETDFKRP